MRVIYGLTHFKSLNKRPVIALGIFDGLHRGHRRIIARLIKEAEKFHTKSLLVTFFPHPQKESTLYSLPHRLKLLAELGIDLCLVIHFTPALCRMPAGDFIQKIIIKKINPLAVLIGRNFTFGRHAQGNWQMLKNYSMKARFKLIVMDVLTYKNKSISSSWIRTLIRGGKLLQTEELLGRPVTIFGRVNPGSSFARSLGYPTANINPDHEILPPFGVYAVRVRLARKLLAGICYIGNRPTINHTRNKPASRQRLFNIEVHIFDFKGNLYGRKIQVEFIKKIRPQKRFSSIPALASQIKKDIRITTRNMVYPYKMPQ